TFASQDGTTIVDGENTRRGILVGGYLTVTIDHLTIQNGFAIQGGGVYIQNGGVLTITNSVIVNNYVTNGIMSIGADGGGIFKDLSGSLILNNSIVSNNTAIF